MASGLLPVYVSVPQQPPLWPGAVVLHVVAGMSEVLRNHVDTGHFSGYGANQGSTSGALRDSR